MPCIGELEFRLELGILQADEIPRTLGFSPSYCLKMGAQRHDVRKNGRISMKPFGSLRFVHGNFGRVGVSKLPNRQVKTESIAQPTSCSRIPVANSMPSASRSMNRRFILWNGEEKKNQRFTQSGNVYPLRGPKTRSLQVRDTRGLLHRDAKRNIVNHRATPASLPI